MNSIKFILLLLMFVSVFFESTLFQIPALFAISLLTYLFYPEILIMLGAFTLGIVLDMLKVGDLGLTSIYILLSFAFLEIVKTVFELKDYKISLILIIILSYIFAKVSSYSPSLISYLVLLLLALVLFRYFPKKASFN